MFRVGRVRNRRRGRRFLRPVLATAAGLSLMLGLVACDPESDDAQEPEEPTTEPATRDETSDEPTDDDTSDASEEPAGPQPLEHPEPGENFEENTQAGAEDAVAYFLTLYSYVYTTGDFEAWNLLVDNDCSFCAGVQERLTELYEHGGFVVTDPVEVRAISSQISSDDRGDYVVQVEAWFPAAETFEGPGEATDSAGAGSVEILALATWVDEAWRITGVSTEATQ